MQHDNHDLKINRMVTTSSSISAPVGITMGCPAGIGPEIILKYFSTRDKNDSHSAVVIGDADILQDVGRSLNLPTPIHIWHPGEIPASQMINVSGRIRAWYAGEHSQPVGRQNIGLMEAVLSP